MVTAFTRNAVKMDVSIGGKFEMFGGNIVGTFESLVCISYDILLL